MTALFAAITQLVAAHPNLAYAAVFLMALTESIPILGVIVPGTAVILAISVLVPTGAVHLWPVMAAATLGAVVGDGLSFWAGRRYHREVLDLWPLNRRPDLVARSEAFFAKHGDWSIVLARFTPVARSFVPLLAGVLRMSPRRFYVANILSACIWAPVHVLPGVAIGASLGLLGETVKPLAVLVVVLAALIYGLVRLAALLLQLLGAGFDRLHGWAAERNSRPRRIVLALVGPSRRRAEGRVAMTLLLIGAVWLFVSLVTGYGTPELLATTDAGIAHALQDLRTSGRDSAMVAITELGDWVVILTVTGAVFLWLAWKRAWRAAGFWLAAVAGVSAAGAAIGATLDSAGSAGFFGSGRPALSFPGGPSAATIVLYGFLTFMIAHANRSAWRLPAVIALMALPVFIAISRLYLGAHVVSDAIGGLAFGAAWLGGIGFFYLRKDSEPLAAGGLLPVCAAALALAGGINIYRSHAADLERYAVQGEVQTMDAADWRSGGWELLPSKRVGFTGKIKEPLTVQTTGDLVDLRRDLAERGWRAPARWTSAHALGWLAADLPPVELPVTPQLAGGRLPKLTLVLENPATPNMSRFVLRLWPAEVEPSSVGGSPVWVGSVVEERLDRQLLLFRRARALPDANAPRDILARGLPTGRLVVRSDVQPDSNWDGRVLLVREAR